MDPAAIAIVPYLNMRPYRHLPPPKGYQLVCLPPQPMMDALHQGKLIAGAIPVGGLPQLPAGRFETLNYGIAARGPVHSVAVFSRIEFNDFSAHSTIRITTESVSSVRLLYLLWDHRPNKTGIPTRANANTPPDGELLIGDAALKRRRQGDDRFVTDLAERWQDDTGHPFVFARWVVANNDPHHRNTLIPWLAEVEAKRQELLEKTATELHLGLSRSEISTYLSHITWSLGPEEEAGQQLFLNEWRQRGRTPVFQTSSP
ncbi:MAG: hypothetical protein HQL83_09850 [Magnetococcales bacterium]|nr:hypothetical protein [Magnetococcales bacterium]